MTYTKAIQSLNEEEAKLFQMVIEGSDTVGAKKIWQRDIHPSRNAVTTQEAIDKLTDLALVTKESGQGEWDLKLHITVRAAEAVGLYWNKHNEWAMRPEVAVSGVFWRDVEAAMYRLRNGDRVTRTRPTFRFTGKLNGLPKTIEITPCAWAIARAGGSLSGARLTYRISPETQCFIEKSVEVAK